MLREETLNLDRFSICGILTYGGANPGNQAVVLFSAGLIHRVGPNRLYVKLARELAQAGFHVFRVDFNGQGDSIHQLDATVTGEVYYLKQILDALEKKLCVNRYILSGLCSGADTAYRCALLDKRVSGLVMINGSGLTDLEVDALYPAAQLQLSQRYYKKAAFDSRKWIKLLTGKSDVLNRRKLASVFNKRRLVIAKPPAAGALLQPDPYRAILENNIPLLIILSEGSIAYDLFRLVYPQGVDEAMNYQLLQDADHTITPVWAQQQIVRVIKTWASTSFSRKVIHQH